MGNRTIAQQIAVLEARRDVLEAAALSAASGITAQSMEGISLSKLGVTAISAELDKVERRLQRLYRGGRGWVVDMSYAAGGNGDTSNTTYVRQNA